MKTLTLVLFLLPLAATGSPQIDPGRDEPQDIIGGTRLRPSEWSFVVQVLTNAGEGKLCTASLIHERWVLTAAHCLEHDGVVATDVHVIVPDLNLPPGGGESYPPRRQRAKRAIPHPDFSLNNSGRWIHDIGVVELNGPIGPAWQRTPIRIMSLRDELTYAPAGAAVVTIGADGEDDAPYYDLYWVEVVTETAAQCGYRAYDEWVRCSRRRAVEPGDSGGPSVVRVPGVGLVQMGVTYGHTESKNIIIRTSAAYDWIAQYVPLPAPLVNSGPASTTLQFPLYLTGRSWHTQLVFTNPFGERDVDVALDFFTQSGRATQMLPPGEEAFTIPPGGSYAVDLFPNGNSIRRGSVAATVSGPIDGYVKLGAGNNAWLGASGTVTLDEAWRRETAVPVTMGDANTRIAVHNPDADSSARVTVTLMSVGGRQLRSRQFTVRPRGHYFIGVQQWFPEYRVVGQQFDGLLMVSNEADAPLAVSAFDINPGGLSGVPIQVDLEELWAEIIESICDAYDCAIDP